MYMPPLTARTCPVIYDASSDARKQTAAATSSGVPAGRAESAPPSPLRLLGERPGHVGLDDPGATTFTVTLREATSRASALLNPISPAFDAA
jgi:hypothetical protein